MDFKSSIYDRIYSDQKGNVAKYKEMFVGKFDLLSLIKYEILVNGLGMIPGAAGLAVRKMFFKSLFKKTGKNCIFGKCISIIYPHKISLGANVIINDYCVLDGKGNNNEGTQLGDNTIIGKNSSINCKDGNIKIGSNTQITSYDSLEMTSGNLSIGNFVGIGLGSKIVGGKHPLFEKIDEDRPPEWMTPVVSSNITIEDRVFIGANVIILDGVRIGKNSVIGAGSLVTKDIPDNALAFGIPAKVVKIRK